MSNSQFTEDQRAELARILEQFASHSELLTTSASHLANVITGPTGAGDPQVEEISGGPSVRDLQDTLFAMPHLIRCVRFGLVGWDDIEVQLEVNDIGRHADSWPTYRITGVIQTIFHQDRFLDFEIKNPAVCIYSTDSKRGWLLPEQPLSKEAVTRAIESGRRPRR